MYPNQGSVGASLVGGQIIGSLAQRPISLSESADPKRPKHAENAIIGLQHTIEQLEGSVAHLIGKINPILIASIPSKEEDCDGTMANMSNIASTVLSFNRALERLRETIEEAAYRVDI